MMWLHILIAAASTMVLGFVWYHPKLFGTPWMNSLGYTEDDLRQGNLPLIYGLGLLLSAFISYRIYQYGGHQEEGMSQFVHGFYHGAVSAGWVAIPVLALNSIFERRSFTNVLINVGYWFLALGLIGGICYSLHAPNPVG